MPCKLTYHTSFILLNNTIKVSYFLQNIQKIFRIAYKCLLLMFRVYYLQSDMLTISNINTPI